MSTLVAQTISNGTISTSSANVISGSAKAWVNFNGTGTVAIRASFNVSSITDNGTGYYTVNMTTAMPDTNYAVTAISKEDNGGTHGNHIITMRRVAFTTTAFAFSTGNTSSTAADHVEVMCAVFR
jgi:hypothetical protein